MFSFSQSTRWALAQLSVCECHPAFSSHTRPQISTNPQGLQSLPFGLGFTNQLSGGQLGIRTRQVSSTRERNGDSDNNIQTEIKPSSPTPSHLKTYKISLLDQYGPSGYAPLLLFYSSATQETISNPSQILKQSLSQTLTHYYPVAGKIGDNLSIDCNDEGVLYIEARVNCSLNDYLSNLDAPSIFKFFPDLFSFNPQNHSFTENPYAIPSRLYESGPSVVTRRFFFDETVIANLKAQATSSRVQKPTRTEVAASVLIKSLTAALKMKSGTQKPTLMNFPVNLRRRATPQLPETCVGNLLLFTTLLSKGDEELDGLVWKMRESVSRINGDVVRSLQGDGGCLKFTEIVQEIHDELFSDSGKVSIGLNSWCNYGLYSIDFGWGKPLWIPVPGFGIKNYMFLMDTRYGNGIEAWVSLDKKVMAVIEQDKKLLSLVSLDPSPLELGSKNFDSCLSLAADVFFFPANQASQRPLQE
ncbi:vinorine synthase-like [Tripterygium wilfordii]|uniref:vinorine synthase-like n=1 Tax=Tripterygium wilfordii TaxID=458696 RepID=UPI0018F80827|nr:vinorine synthase-like [Tripterygium wilfordii]